MAKVTLFDFLNDICYGKRGDLLTDETQSAFSEFMILRFLGMDDGLLPLVNFINQYQETLTKQQLYQLLIHLVPRRKRYLKYRGKSQKTETSELIERLAQTFQISQTKAQQYLNLIDGPTRQDFLESFGEVVT